MAVKELRAYAQKRRPQSPRGELKRKQILDAAARVLARRGYVSTQLSEIAAEAGTHSGSLYYHFESREELIEEVLLEGVRLLFARTRAVVDEMPRESTPMERLCAAIRAHLKFALLESAYALAAARSGGQFARRHVEENQREVSALRQVRRRSDPGCDEGRRNRSQVRSQRLAHVDHRRSQLYA